MTPQLTDKLVVDESTWQQSTTIRGIIVRRVGALLATVVLTGAVDIDVLIRDVATGLRLCLLHAPPCLPLLLAQRLLLAGAQEAHDSIGSAAR